MAKIQNSKSKILTLKRQDCHLSAQELFIVFPVRDVISCMLENPRWLVEMFVEHLHTIRMMDFFFPALRNSTAMDITLDISGCITICRYGNKEMRKHKGGNSSILLEPQNLVEYTISVFSFNLIGQKECITVVSQPVKSGYLSSLPLTSTRCFHAQNSSSLDVCFFTIVLL